MLEARLPPRCGLPGRDVQETGRNEPGIEPRTSEKGPCRGLLRGPRGHGRGDEKAPAPARSQDERLRDVERKLEQTIKALESLKREVGR